MVTFFQDMIYEDAFKSVLVKLKMYVNKTN